MNSLLKNLLFIDIETVSLTKHYDDLSPRLQTAWDKKATQLDANCSDFAKAYFDKAAIYAEFGKVIVIGIGFFHENEKNELCLRIKSISSKDETELLQKIIDLVSKGFSASKIAICAHNGKEFDIPYLCRRMLVNGIPLPEYLAVSGKKPWEIRHFDTLEMWKFGDRKSYTSLELLAAIFDIETSKNGIDGSKVNTTYYDDQNLDLIEEYCKRDVAVLAQLFLKMNCLSLPKQENIFFI